MNLALFGRSRRVLGTHAVIAAAIGSLMLAAPIAGSADDTLVTANYGSADAGQVPMAPKPSPPAGPKAVSPGTGEQPSAVAGVNCSSGFHCLFFSDVNSSKHQYFDSVDHFIGDTFSGGNGVGAGDPVDNNSWAASNSSTGNRESHWYDGQFHSGFLFCVNPGATVHSLPTNLRDRVSSLRLMPRTSVRCLSN